jgi:hypothetical protein
MLNEPIADITASMFFRHSSEKVRQSSDHVGALHGSLQLVIVASYSARLTALG